MTTELPRGLIYNPEHSSLLVIGSNSANGCTHQQHNPDHDAQSVFSLIKEKTGFRDSMSSLITTSGNCTKKGLKDALKELTCKITPDEEGLLAFIYCGGGCSLQSGALSGELDHNGEDNCKYSLVLNDFDPNDSESHVTGETIGTILANSSVKPMQMLVVLDCPFAKEISKDIEKHIEINELILVVSPYHYLSPLQSSTFNHFFRVFLSTPNLTGDGVVKFRSIFSKVKNCCEALSGLTVVRDGQILKMNKVSPEGQFIRTFQDTDAAMKRVEEEEDGDQDEVDAGGKFDIFYKRYYRKYLFKRVKLCNTAKDWVHDVTRVPLVVLKEHGVLRDEVLNAVVGSMMFSIATIQYNSQGGSDSLFSSNVFIQAYIYVAAALDMVDQDIDLQNISLLQLAQEFYVKVLHTNNINYQEVTQLMKKIEKDTPNVFS